MADEMIHVRKVGATVNGHAGLIVEGALDGARREVAEATRMDLGQQMDSVFQHQTGAYISKLQIQRTAVTSYRVWDGGVAYGPWLEGTGSRNAPVTKFEGYHSFQIVGNRMAQKSREITEAWIARATKVI